MQMRANRQTEVQGEESAGTMRNLFDGLFRRPGGSRLLDAGGLKGAASRATGLDDFGDPPIDEPLAVLTRALQNEAELSMTGRWITRLHLLDLLKNRLRLAADRRGDPRVRAQRIEQPIFITGMPRSGTTLLHALLAEDPANRAPLHWEVMAPWPAPDGEAAGPDPRIARAERHLRFAALMRPKLKTVHLLGATLPEECVTITASSFHSFLFDELYRVPSYQAWLKAHGKGEAYAYHRRFLQHLQSRGPARRWVLKSPSHMFALDDLFATYPDACVIQTHRDPLDVLASTASLESLLLGMFSNRVDPREIGAEVADSVAEQVERAMDFRDRLAGSADRFFDVAYPDLVRDPIEVVRRAYAHFGLEWTPAAERRMRAFMAANPQHKNGRHVYRLADFGIDVTAVDRRFARYRERFGIGRETAQSGGVSGAGGAG